MRIALKDTLTVSEITSYIKQLVDGDEVLSYAAVSGEISNFKAHYASGHLYFSLKDEGAQMKAVMFRSAAATLDFEPKDGEAVKAYGRISVYPQGGQYQLYVTRLVRDGAGSLWQQYERLKKQLEAEGLFEESRKKPLPRFPRRVGVITSKTGAAVRDIISVMTRRWPLAEIVFCGASVQGTEAPAELRRALALMIEKGKVDTVIIGRGGGSIEDLWAFNDEMLVRDIATCPIPIISAVGHETDFTLSDFAADVRAPTPSAAAELAVPDRAEYTARLAALDSSMKNSFISRISDLRQYIDSLAGRGVMRSPLGSIEWRRKELESIHRLLMSRMEKIKTQKNARLTALVSGLNALSPLNVIDRGYVLASDGEGRTVQGAGSLKAGDELILRFADGIAEATVTNTELFYGDEKNG
ncbi:MAG: exodeoxyribonuclease VII large subunit [Ruminococcaceae bacterium]|nr:exodeoxyribonuclease VII large subunit [Oscillospiraceae bacterium]